MSGGKSAAEDFSFHAGREGKNRWILLIQILPNVLKKVGDSGFSNSPKQDRPKESAGQGISLDFRI